MRLYRSQIPGIAEDIITTLQLDGDIVVENDDRSDAEQDIRAIMDEYLRQESRVVQETREHMEAQLVLSLYSLNFPNLVLDQTA